MLELGCGVGPITHRLLALGHEVAAVDNSAAMLEQVHGARTVLADVEVDGDSWTQRFSAAILDDDQLIAEAADAGLVFDAWLDPVGTWARFAVR